MSHMIQPQILVLKEGTENAKGKEQIISNINACQALVDVIKTTLVINLFFNKIYLKNLIILKLFSSFEIKFTLKKGT
jgi:hypothetical protein